MKYKMSEELSARQLTVNLANSIIIISIFDITVELAFILSTMIYFWS